MKFRGFPPIDHPNDEDLSLPPQEANTASWGPRSLGTPKPQKQRRGMDGAPRVCGRAVFERDFAAWVDFLEQVEGVCAGVETPAYQPAALYNQFLLPETQRERFDVVLVSWGLPASLRTEVASGTAPQTWPRVY
jgi:hypothetical protein